MASQYMTIPVWDGVEPWQRSLVRKFLYQHIQRCLGRGSHCFDSLDELYEKLSIGHVAWQSVSVLKLSYKQVCEGENGQLPFMYISKRMLRKLLRELRYVRLQTNTNVGVERDGLKRVILNVN